MHDCMGNWEINDHHKNSGHNAYRCHSVKLQLHCTFYQYDNTHRQADNAGDKAGNIFSNVSRVADVDQEMSGKSKEDAKPQAIKYLTGEIIGQKADAEKRNELLIDCTGKSHISKSPVSLRHLGKSFKHIGIMLKEPAKSYDFLHIVKNKNDR